MAVAKTGRGSGAGGSVPLLPILSVNFIGTLGYSIVMPFLVFLVTRWGGNALVYGLIGATYSAFKFIGAPILGGLLFGILQGSVFLLSAGTIFVAAGLALPTHRFRSAA